ncbi:MAG: hypothetical protein R3345_07855 [Fulvivirga sp.]|nr:hypothetical protein [Fulvivirga sp.]
MKTIFTLILCFLSVFLSVGQSDLVAEVATDQAVLAVDYENPDILSIEDSRISLEYENFAYEKNLVINLNGFYLRADDEIEVHYVNGQHVIYEVGANIQFENVGIQLPLNEQEVKYLTTTGIKYIKIKDKTLWLRQEHLEIEVKKAIKAFT